ncbi:hypothetical protein, partial [Thalassospira sp. MCCC 1A01428]|uniref:hypothetical protein n=1 Tax=Thalassospira sp. MCCC 1A01428 TaxID=1470575 RepID=UPI000A23E4B6
MKLPLVVAAGLTVLVTAKAVSWIYNSLTEQEREKQQHERERSDQIRARARAANVQQEAERSKTYQQMAQDQARLLFESIREHRQAAAEVPAELETLEQMISSEVSNKTSSPYRKSALRREYARIEDAIVRLKEYQRYLSFEEQRINQLLYEEDYEALLKLDTVKPLLPLEWLYPGKLVLVSMDEIGSKRPLTA